jgi:mannose-P-dolichol utilization defect protein 1
MQTAGQGFFSGLSFTVYGESFIIAAQNLIIILLFWTYNKSVGFLEKLVIFAFLVGYAVLLFDPLGKGILTEEHFKMITSASTVMNVMAKLPQIYTIFSNKSTGALAFFSFFLNFAGSVARLGTVLIESDDFMFRL